MLWVLIRIALPKIILQLSSNTHFICSSDIQVSKLASGGKVCSCYRRVLLREELARWFTGKGQKA